MRYILTNTNLTYYLNGNMYAANKSHPSYDDVIESIRKYSNNNAPYLLEGAHLFLSQMTNDTITCSEGRHLYKGSKIRGISLQFLIKYLLRNLPLEPLYKLIEKCNAYPFGWTPQISENSLITLEGNLIVCGANAGDNGVDDFNPSNAVVPRKLGLKYTNKPISFRYPYSVEQSDLKFFRYHYLIDVDPRYLYRDAPNKTAYGTFIGGFEVTVKHALLAVVTPDAEVPEEYLPYLQNESATHINLSKGLPV